MPFSVERVLKRVRTQLQDADNVRWPLPELLLWVNDAVREIARDAPEAVSDVVTIPLVAGTRQPMPATVGQILSVVCNVTVSGGIVTRLNAVTPTKARILNAIKPEWADASRTPFAPLVDHFVEDATLDGYFYVCPGNTGTGAIECIVAPAFEDIEEPANPFALTSYVPLMVPLRERLLTAVADYVYARALAKDLNVPGAANLAQLHMQKFTQALMGRAAAEARANPAAPAA